MTDCDLFKEAIRRENLDGWLFCNFAHRDPLTDSLLSLPPQSVSSRFWVYFLSAQGNSVKITHVIEADILDSLPGKRSTYTSREELKACLLALGSPTVAVLSDPALLILSTIAASSRDLFAECGIRMVSAASCVQRVRGLLSQDGIASHERAAKTLYAIVDEAWAFLKITLNSGQPLFEADIQSFMLSLLAKESLITSHPPIVAAGIASSNPHYDLKDRGRRILEGDVVQFDIWAKEEGGIYADIAWAGYCGTEVPSGIEANFTLVRAARDAVFERLKTACSANEMLRGMDMDAAARAVLVEGAPSHAIKHRTGHGIDSECHGSGVNLDCIEFPDNRFILEGSCFSVEPGLYFTDYGFRSEINIYISGGMPVISGNGPQQCLMRFSAKERIVQ